MTDDMSRLLLAHAIGAAKAGEYQEARAFLERVLARRPSRRQRVNAHYWLAQVSDDPAEKREHLEQVLSLDPIHPEARRELAILDGELRREELVDSTLLGAPVPSPSPTTGPARRFACPQCGAPMMFVPGDSALRCCHCGFALSLPAEALEHEPLHRDHDFLVALATARGHLTATRARTFTCQTCGAHYFLETDSLSFSCPYCRSTYVADVVEERALVPPTSIIVAQIPEAEAISQAHHWLDQHYLRRHVQMSTPQGVYLPVWTFDVLGVVKDGEGSGRLFLEEDLPVVATSSLPDNLGTCAHSFDYAGTRPYHPSFLAGWPAEVYTLSVADASLVARSLVHQRAREWRAHQGRPSSSSSERADERLITVVVERFALVMVPVWVIPWHVRGHAAPLTLLVNGQNGSVCAQRPERTWWHRLKAWLLHA
ncbi:MAG: hypothetical protein Q9O62_10590 [Ardenticatenia bacterium]|nr:hypothetical protein [Ardenticatenia bacterium]